MRSASLLLQLVAIGALLGAFAGSPADARPVRASSLAAFDSAMNAVVGQGYPGGSLAVVRDDKLVYTRGYGSANMNLAATPLTPYPHASLSQAGAGAPPASPRPEGRGEPNIPCLP